MYAFGTSAVHEDTDLAQTRLAICVPIYVLELLPIDPSMACERLH